VADWSGVCLLAANRRSNCSLMRAMYGRIMRCGIISSCQSAATCKIVKALLATSLSRVSTRLMFTLTYLYFENQESLVDAKGNERQRCMFESPLQTKPKLTDPTLGTNYEAFTYARWHHRLAWLLLLEWPNALYAGCPSLSLVILMQFALEL